MFRARELQVLQRAVATAIDESTGDDVELCALYSKLAVAYRHQEMHEIMQEFLGVSKSYMLRMSDFDPVDVRGIPMTKVHRRTFGIAPDDLKYIHEGPNYNRPEDRSGVQGEKFRQWMPRFIPLTPPHHITPEVMNRILRSIDDKEMG